MQCVSNRCWKKLRHPFQKSSLFQRKAGPFGSVKLSKDTWKMPRFWDTKSHYNILQYITIKKLIYDHIIITTVYTYVFKRVSNFCLFSENYVLDQNGIFRQERCFSWFGDILHFGQSQDILKISEVPKPRQSSSITESALFEAATNQWETYLGVMANAFCWSVAVDVVAIKSSSNPTTKDLNYVPSSLDWFAMAILATVIVLVSLSCTGAL